MPFRWALRRTSWPFHHTHLVMFTVSEAVVDQTPTTLILVGFNPNKFNSIQFNSPLFFSPPFSTTLTYSYLLLSTAICV